MCYSLMSGSYKGKNKKVLERNSGLLNPLRLFQPDGGGGICNNTGGCHNNDCLSRHELLWSEAAFIDHSTDAQY